MMTIHLFIGGPKHGQEIDVPDDAYDFNVSNFGEFVFDSFLEPVADRYRIIRYRKVKFGARTENDQGFRYIFVVDGMPDEQAGIDLRELLAVRWALGKALT